MKQSTSFIDRDPDAVNSAIDPDAPAGETAEPSTPRGPKRVHVPSLVSVAPRAAIEQIRELGLVPAVESEAVSDPALVGVIFAQEPPAESEAARGDVVELLLGKAPAVTDEPAAADPPSLDEHDDWFDADLPPAIEGETELLPASDASEMPLEEERTLGEQQMEIGRVLVSRKRRRPSAARPSPIAHVSDEEHHDSPTPPHPSRSHSRPSQAAKGSPLLGLVVVMQLVLMVVLLIVALGSHGSAPVPQPAAVRRAVQAPQERHVVHDVARRPGPERSRGRRSGGPHHQRRDRGHEADSAPPGSSVLSAPPVAATPAPSPVRVPVAPCEMCLEQPPSP